MAWYSFTPPGMSTPNPANPFHYTLEPLGPPSCLSNQHVCGLQADDDSGRPIITFDLLAEIAQALENRTPSVNVLLKS